MGARAQIAWLCLVVAIALGWAVRAGSPPTPRRENAAATVPSPAPVAVTAPRVGFTVHWDFFNTAAEAERLVAFAIASGAEILSVVPPPHIWEQPESLTVLRRIFAVTREHGVAVVLNRIDGSSLAPDGVQRTNWLYANVLTERGRLPAGQPTPDFFLATVGKADYALWLHDETAFYAENFSQEANLLAFGVGLFNEPFVSQRGSLLCFDPTTGSYEIAQYTGYAAALWHARLRLEFGGTIGRLNALFGSHFSAFDLVPLPRNESDPAFARADLAYLDFTAAVNAWVVTQLQECQRLWHARAHRDVPFILQFSGYLPEKFEKGRPAFGALDIFDWMTRADALGLSLYTNCEYPDWGHASDIAMVNFLRLGALLGKPVFVLEGGSECDGAVLDARELRFFAETVRPLGPASVIYEFLKTTVFEHFATSAGKLLGSDWRPRPEAVGAVGEALLLAKRPDGGGPRVFVLDDLGSAPDAPRLAVRRQLMRAAMKRPLTFVPPTALGALPAGSTLAVQTEGTLPALRQLLAPRQITVVPAGEVLASPASQ